MALPFSAKVDVGCICSATFKSTVWQQDFLEQEPPVFILFRGIEVSAKSDEEGYDARGLPRGVGFLRPLDGMSAAADASSPKPICVCVAEEVAGWR